MLCNGLSNLTSLNLPTSLNRLTSYILYGCSKLKTINVGANVTVIDYHFLYNSGVTTVNFASGSKYKQEGNYIMSSDGYSLVYVIENSATSLSVPSGVETIGNNAFVSCSLLQSITIPSSVTNIGDSAFKDCSSLTRISIDKEEGSVTGAPWGAPYGLRAIYWN